MAKLTDVQIFEAALQAGFTPDQAVTMTAIALAESGGETGALNDVGEHSVGLWQINTAVHDWHPSQGTDPLLNARMAYEVSGGGRDISRWTVTHSSKGSRYLPFRGRAEAAAAAAGYPGAEGQWNPPTGYSDNNVGAAPPGSDSQPVFEPGEIPPFVEGAAGATDAPVPTGAAASPVADDNPFDRDGDGVFDAVEEWLGEDLLPDASTPLPDPAAPGHSHAHSHSHSHSHSHGTPIDRDALQNGQLADHMLVDVTGGNDALLAGRPANAWQAMVAAAAADGVDITFSDAYRPLADQERLARDLGLYSQGGRAAAPGTSNHGLGLAVDVNRTPEAMAWLDENAADYGWIADVPREPWHFNYREHLDPNPDRGPVGGGPTALDDGAADNPFDTDGDGIYDAVEEWLQDQGHVLPGNEPPPDGGLDPGGSTPPPTPGGGHDHGGHAHAASGGHVCTHGPGESCPSCGSGGDEAEEAMGCAHGPGESCPACETGGDDVEGVDAEVESLGPLSPDEMRGLDDILGRFELDTTGELRFESLAPDEQLGLRDALSDLYVERVGGDRESFTSQFDEILSERNGDLELTEVLDLFDDF